MSLPIYPDRQTPSAQYRCCFFKVSGVRQNLNVLSLYGNPHLDDRIFDCLLTSTAAVQAEDVCASFLFASDFNGNNREWPFKSSSSRMAMATVHSYWCCCGAAFDFASVSGTDQLAVRLTHAHSGTIDSEDKPWFDDQFRNDFRLKQEAMTLSSVISGGPLFSPLCSARVRHCLRLLVGVVDWCVSRLELLIRCQNILQKAVHGVC